MSKESYDNQSKEKWKKALAWYLSKENTSVASQDCSYPQLPEKNAKRN